MALLSNKQLAQILEEAAAVHLTNGQYFDHSSSPKVDNYSCLAAEFAAERWASERHPEYPELPHRVSQEVLAFISRCEPSIAVSMFESDPDGPFGATGSTVSTEGTQLWRALWLTNLAYVARHGLMS